MDWRFGHLIEVGRLEVAGFVSDESLDQLYARAKVYLQPSMHEGFGCSVAEAMLRNCVPVVAATGSLPEVVGRAGVYVDTDDPQMAADAVMRVLRGEVILEENPRSRILDKFQVERRRWRLLSLMDCVLNGESRLRSVDPD